MSNLRLSGVRDFAEFHATLDEAIKNAHRCIIIIVVVVVVIIIVI